MLSSYAPFITRLVLVAERHKIVDIRRRQSTIFHWFYKWHAHEVMPFKNQSLAGRYCMALLPFRKLRLLVVGGRQERVIMDNLCKRLRRCRVIGLEDEISGREGLALWDSLWAFGEFWDDAKWYEAVMVPGENGERVLKQLVKEEEYERMRSQAVN
jgi:hypothetical protein